MNKLSRMKLTLPNFFMQIRIFLPMYRNISIIVTLGTYL
jgi:hypothetical protein